MEREDGHLPTNYIYYIYMKLKKYFIRRLWEIYWRKKMNAQESLVWKLYSEAISTTEVWLDDVTFNQKVGGEWLKLHRKRVRGMYRGKSFNYTIFQLLYPEFHISIRQDCNEYVQSDKDSRRKNWFWWKHINTIYVIHAYKYENFHEDVYTGISILK